ncbi:MAG: hypothetical protein DRO00_01120 [Thermoproteota archaeon]|nr:MAG: hypothetical protein DRO00_01120 [Candidatus Korarchaeota archaeon]
MTAFAFLLVFWLGGSLILGTAVEESCKSLATKVLGRILLFTYSVLTAKLCHKIYEGLHENKFSWYGESREPALYIGRDDEY